MDGDKSTQQSDDSMPTPPDLTDLFAQHSKRINDACQQAAAAFSGVKDRDKQIETLSKSLTSEVTKVQTLAAAATTPQLAAVAAPAMKLMATMAFARVAPTAQLAQQALQSGFKQIKE
ncbi:MAG: hypothetical protein NXI13_08920 [Proteobacteria bacterium]|nr:hypothetical protein [Pseudomonadota bacterium]